MSKPKRVTLAPEVNTWFQCAKETPWLKDRFKKAVKSIKLMREVGPGHRSFQSHKMENLPGPDGREIWNSYVENAAPNAWRMYWIRDDDEGIYIISIGPHSHTPGKQPDTTRKGKTKDS